MARSTTQTDVANRALRKIGANKIDGLITSTTDPNAIIMNDLYDDTLAYVLSEGFWPVSTKRVVLDYATGVSNEWTKYELNNIYDKPTDFIRMVGWSDETAIVREEGEYFLSDSPGTTSTLTVNQNDVDAWSDASVAYVEGDYSKNDDAVYYCKADNTSAAASEPGVGADWTDYWILGEETVTDIWSFTVVTRLGIIYVGFDEDIEAWAPFFLEAFVDRLSLDASYTRIQSTTASAEIKARYDESIAKAKAKAAQGQTPQTPKADMWINAKYSGEIINGARRIFYRS